MSYLCIDAQEDLDEEACPEGFKLSGTVPEAQQDSEAPRDATAGTQSTLFGKLLMFLVLSAGVAAWCM